MPASAQPLPPETRSGPPQTVSPQTAPTLTVPPAHLIDRGDDVAVALRPLAPGELLALGTRTVTVAAPVPAGHKLALRPIRAGEEVRKYGWPIGRATADIPAGAHVHAHNLTTTLSGALDYAWRRLPPPLPSPSPAVESMFAGYRRADGRVGTRNEIWVLCTVGCVGRTAQRIATAAAAKYAGRVDGVVAFPHPFGCSQLGDDLERTRRLLAALIRHPNAGGVLILGLGCESNTLDTLLDAAGPVDPARLRTVTAQSVEDEMEAGLEAVEELVRVAERDQRSPCPVADLVVGLKCGGSDGFSGLTANPLLGRITDWVTTAGGSAVLSEVPEIFGAEQLLMARAATRDVFDGLVGLINGFKQHFLDHGQPVHENPSPGNIAGGITTLEEKSLGAVQKGGRAMVTDVLPYGGRVTRPGLSVLEAPGNDGVSATAMAAAGATVLLFTTGRGTPLGFPVPTLKIATNSDLAARKSGWIDFDAGGVLQPDGMEGAADALARLVLATAAGRPTRNELNGERDIALWKTGVTL